MRPNEATMAVALAIGTNDHLFINPESMDFVRLRRAISSEMRLKRILFPDLYDPELAQELFACNRFSSQVSARDTVKILRGHDQGVFQIGHTVVGPFGCLESRQIRTMKPDREVPGFRCENPGCTRIHSLILTTGEEALINKAREAFRDLQSGQIEDPPSVEFKRFRLAAVKASREDPLAGGEGLLELIGDSLDLQEVQAILGAALRSSLRSDPALRAQFSTISGRILGDPSEFSAGLTRNEALHILHLMSNRELITACDSTIRSGGVRVMTDRTRATRLSRFGARPAEIGSLGVRFISTQVENGDIGHLLAHLYEQEPDELAFVLDKPTDSSLDELISTVFQQMTASEVVESCLSGTLQRARMACSLLGVAYDGMGRAALSDVLSWRLGVAGEQSTSNSSSLIKQIDEYLRKSPLLTESDKRGALSNLFTGLETELMLTLRFTSWSMLTDHYSSEDGFSAYLDRLPAVDHILTYSTAKPTLQPLAAGLTRLANELESAPPISRGEDSLPPECLSTGRPFAFSNIFMFHNLTAESGQEICLTLREGGRDFSRQEVLDVRNGASHGNAAFPTDELVETALRYCRQGLTRLRETGLTPVLFDRLGISGSIGHVEARYQSESLNAIIRIPEWPLAPRMPGIPERAVFVSSARGSGWGPLRFRVPDDDNGGDRWKSWPPSRRVEETGPNWSAPRGMVQEEVG
jgi:hypothetical protein